jgi:hypothetical protein
LEYREEEEMQELTEREKGYIEGIIDGEGCLYMSKSHQICLEIANTNLNLLLYLQEKIGGKISLKKPPLKIPNAKPCFRLLLNKKEVYSLLNQINLKAKKQQQELILKALNIMEKARIPLEKHKELERIRKKLKKIKSESCPKIVNLSSRDYLKVVVKNEDKMPHLW